MRALLEKQAGLAEREGDNFLAGFQRVLSFKEEDIFQERREERRSIAEGGEETLLF